MTDNNIQDQKRNQPQRQAGGNTTPQQGQKKDQDKNPATKAKGVDAEKDMRPEDRGVS